MEDGSLKAVGKDADRAAAGLDKAGKSGDKYQKVQKGIGQTGLSSAKGFSKMAGSIQGGLVPAYATLAAHVFAVTAAFGVLSRAQAVKQLNEGLLFTGRAAGDNLTIVTKNLKEITDNAISSADAMRALAVGVSAGFSEAQMEGLTRVAKGASLALGRDMTDALDRLVRGAAKLEPEILDELGIMVRLDDATEKYAASLGIAVGELTQFERRMAFTNEIIEQGQSKFGALSQSVASNPFNQLASTFDNLVKAGMNLMNSVFGPIAGFLAGNTTALVGAIGALGTGVITMMVPALTQGGQAAREFADQMAESAKQSIAGTKAVKGSPKVFTDLAKKISSGTASTKDFDNATSSLKKSIESHKRQMPGYIKQYGEGSTEVQKKTLKLQANEKALDELTKAQLLEAQATRKGAQADILANASAGNFKITLTLLRAEILAVRAQTALDTAGKSLLARAYAQVSMWAGIATLSVKAFGLALVSSIPIIGQVILGAMLLWEGVKWLFGSDAEKTVSPLASVLEEGEERFAEFPNIINQMAESYDAAATASERYLITLKSQNGILKQTVAQVRNLRIAEEVNQAMKLASAQRKLKAAKLAEKNAKELLDKAGVNVEEGKEVGGFKKLGERIAGSALRGGVSSKDRVAAITAYNASLQNQATLLTEISQLEAATTGPSEERIAATTKAILEYIKASQTQLNTTKEGSDEFINLQNNIAEAEGILNTLSADTLPDAERKLNTLSNTTNKTVHSFQALKDAGAEVDALFAKNSAVSGVFADQIKILDKGLEALTRTTDSTAQLEELQKAFEKFGITDEAELQHLRTRFALVSDFRKVEASMVQANVNQRNKLNKAGLKDVALLNQQAEQTVLRNVLLEEQKLAIKSGEDGLAQEVKLLKLANNEEKTRIALIKARQEDSGRLGGSAIDSATKVTAYAEINQETFEGAGSADQIKMLSEAINPMMKDLEKLGPEGELIASAIAGTLALGESFERLTEKLQKLGFTSSMTFTEMKEKFSELSFQDQLGVISAGLQAAGAAVSALGNAMAAAAANNISGLDNQISAEKRRDGQSAASLQKIAAMEKKKEAMKKKEFETNKKFQLANAIIATAVGVTQALAIPVIGLFLAPLIAAMGMAQVAVISKMSYQGGASSVPSPSPSKVAVGSRQSSVDLAKGENAGGEQAYMRGASGTGQGMTDFKPAFAGYKNRAAGGFVVGEQGPEVFMPDVPGEIIPSGKQAGGLTNVNFSISTVDATGVEDLLMNQRGNIIGMIREAANEHGEMFLETVEEKSY